MFQTTSPPETEQPAATSVQEVINDVDNLKVPDSSLLEGYVLESTTLHEATQSACLEYRHSGANGDSVLLIAQGPIASAPPLEKIPDLPEYLSLQEAVTIGGARKAAMLPAGSEAHGRAAISPRRSIPRIPMPWRPGSPGSLKVANTTCTPPAAAAPRRAA